MAGEVTPNATEEQPAPVENHECDACGQLDDHPMVHVSGLWQNAPNSFKAAPSFHFDCLPDEFLGLLNGPANEVTRAARAAALDGTHGDDLRAYIQSLPTDNDVSDEEQYKALTGQEWSGPGEATESQEG